MSKVSNKINRAEKRQKKIKGRNLLELNKHLNNYFLYRFAKVLVILLFLYFMLIYFSR